MAWLWECIPWACKANSSHQCQVDGKPKIFAKAVTQVQKNLNAVCIFCRFKDLVSLSQPWTASSKAKSTKYCGDNNHPHLQVGKFVVWEVKTTVKFAFFDLKKVPPALTYFSSSSWVLSFFFAPMVRDSNLFRSSSVRLRNLERKSMFSLITWNILIPIFSEEQFQKSTLKPFLNSKKLSTPLFNYSVEGKCGGLAWEKEHLQI